MKLTSNIKQVCAQSVNKITMRKINDTRIFVNEVETQWREKPLRGRWRSRHHFKGSRSSTNWAGYESMSKEVQGCTQRTHPRVMSSSKFVEAHWAWSTWATKNRHLDSSSRRIRSRLRIGKKYFGSILEGSDCMAILGATFFPFMLSFVSFYMTLGIQLFFPIPTLFFRQVGIYYSFD
jgi:hypothetical protein